MKIHYSDNKGVTMIELLVAMSIFAIFVTVAIGGFVQALSNQRLVLRLMAATDNMSLTLEQIMREARVSNVYEPIPGKSHTLKLIRVESGIGGDEEYLIEYSYDSISKSIMRTKTRLVHGSPTNDVTEKKFNANNVDITDFSVIDQQIVPAGPVRITLLVGVSVTDKSRTITNHIQTTVSTRLF